MTRSEMNPVAVKNATPVTIATRVAMYRPRLLRTPRHASVRTAQPSKRFMRSSTRSVVGSSIASTIWPSARNSTVSA